MIDMKAYQRSFVILTHQRSGSEWLRGLLDSHRYIQCCGELNKRFARYKPGKVLEAYFGGRNDAVTRGYKVMLNDGAPAALFRSIRVIILERNELELIVSDIINSQKGKTGRRAHSVSEEKAIKFRINESEFVKRLTSYRKLKDKYPNFLFKNHLVVRYEDMLGDLDRELVRVCDFLGVPYDDGMCSTVVKQNPTKLEDYIVNLEGLRKLL